MITLINKKKVFYVSLDKKKRLKFIFTSILVRNSQKHEFVFCINKFSIIFLRDIFFHGLFIKMCVSTAH